MPKLQTQTKKNGGGIRFHLTIPSDYVRLLGWRKGIDLAVIPSRNERELTIKEFPRGELDGFEAKE